MGTCGAGLGTGTVAQISRPHALRAGPSSVSDEQLEGCPGGWVGSVLSRAQGRLRMMGAEETVVKLRGEKAVVGVVIDAETGQIVGVDLIASTC